jgi:hypothetical protein
MKCNVSFIEFILFEKLLLINFQSLGISPVLQVFLDCLSLIERPSQKHHTKRVSTGTSHFYKDVLETMPIASSRITLIR